MPTDVRQLLVRFSGDLATKAPPTRRRFVQRLVRNLKDALKAEGIAASVLRTHNRLYIQCEEESAEEGGEDNAGDAARAAETAARVFGVQSVSIADEVPWTELADLVDAGVERFGDAVRGKRFAVRVKRVGDRARFTLRGVEVERALGAALLRGGADGTSVDLTQPDVAVRMELMANRAYFFRDTLMGPGGLPLGVEGRGIALVSGGFDSAVAAWQLMKRGVAIDYVFCNLGGREHQLGTLRVVKVLADRWSYGTRPHFHAIDFDLVSRELQARTTTRYWQIVLKRMMLRAGEQVAEEREAPVLITGDAVGQVSSQTLQNLAVIDRAAERVVLRPLVGFNKDEIIGIARHIGTEEVSKLVDEYCALVPSKPATGARLAAIEEEEAKLEPLLGDAGALERAVRERSVFDLRTLDLGALDMPELRTDSIPDDDVVVLDLRSKAAYQGWHYPDALFLEFARALRAYEQMAGDTRYVLYCEFGLKSAHLAELMRARGLDATHFAGGLKQLVAYAKERGLPTPESIVGGV